jgi:hypothetical protein
MPSVLHLQVLTRAEHGMQNTASSMEQQNDERWSKAENQQGHRVSGAQFKWKWGGHVARMDQRRCARVTSVWDVRLGKRSTGRPKAQWADIFKRAAGQWSRTANNWREQRTHTHTHTQNIRKSDIYRNSSPSDKTLELSLVPPGGLFPPWDLLGLFIYLFIMFIQKAIPKYFSRPWPFSRNVYVKYKKYYWLILNKAILASAEYFMYILAQQNTRYSVKYECV